MVSTWVRNVPSRPMRFRFFPGQRVAAKSGSSSLLGMARRSAEMEGPCDCSSLPRDDGPGQGSRREASSAPTMTRVMPARAIPVTWSSRNKTPSTTATTGMT